MLQYISKFRDDLLLIVMFRGTTGIWGYGR